MELSRDRFIDQFYIPLHVACLRLWRKRKTVPTFLSTTFYETITTSGGKIAVSGAAFSDVVTPLIEELHRTLPKGERPEPKHLAGVLYDTLDGAGVEVTIKPFVMITPAKSHSS
jgi:hypothetical protein